MTEQVLKLRLIARIDLLISTFRLRRAFNEQAVRTSHSKIGAVSQNRSVLKAIDECDVALKKLELLKANVSKMASTQLMQLLKNYGQYSYENLEKEIRRFLRNSGLIC